MPPLYLFNRRWNIGTDDFVYFSLIELVLLLSLISIFMLYADISETPFKCSIDLFYKIIYFGLGIIIICNIVLAAILIYLSAQGTIIEVSKRRGVPYCIYGKILILLVEIVFSSLGFSLQYRPRRLVGDCNVKIYKVFQIIFCSFLVFLFIYIILFWIYYDKLGNRRFYQNSALPSTLSETVYNIKKKQFWKNQLQSLLCMYSPSFEERNALDDIAEIFAVLNKQSNLIWSDYQVGFYLMAAEDKNLDKLHKLKLKLDPNSSYIFFVDNVKVIEEFTNLSSNSNVVSNSCGYIKYEDDTQCTLPQKRFISKVLISVYDFFCEKLVKPNISNNATSASDLENKDGQYVSIHVPSFSSHHSNIEDSFTWLQLEEALITHSRALSKLSNWRDLRFVYYFCTVAKASYGWPLNLLLRDKSDSCLKTYKDICCKSSSSCSHSKCICCTYDINNSDNHHIIYPKGKLCSKHINTIISKTYLTTEDLICASFYNKEFYSPFFVAVSHDMKVIILSIRGSFSIKDILTDLNANVVDFEEDYLVNCKAHSGMTKAAYKLKHTLQHSNILSGVMDKYKEYRLILTGHSLGAGIAVILGCLLYNEYPNLKCYAYGIPMGSVNHKMADFCKDFVLTVINGFDWIPRLSFKSIIKTKNRLHDCLVNCCEPKFKLTFLMLCLSKSSSLAEESTWNMLNMYRRNEDFQKNDDTEMKLPGQIINIVDLRTLGLSERPKSFFIPMITCSKQFDFLPIRCDMFQDHLPSSYTNRLYDIIKINNIVTPRCCHFLDHYWPPDNLIDDILLPSLNIFDKSKSLTPINNTEPFLMNEANGTLLKVAEVITVV